MNVADFLDIAELRLAQAGYAESFAAAVQAGASNADALAVADAALPTITTQVEALFAVLRKIAEDVA